MSVETKLARFFSTKHACERMTVVTQEGTAKTAAVERQMRVVWQRSSAANVLYFPFSQATPRTMRVTASCFCDSQPVS